MIHPNYVTVLAIVAIHRDRPASCVRSPAGSRLSRAIGRRSPHASNLRFDDLYAFGMLSKRRTHLYASPASVLECVRWGAALEALETAAGVLVATALLLLGIILQRRLKNRDEAWLIKRLDALAVMENSADLLLGNPEAEPRLVALQRQRVQQWLAALPEQDLRRPYPMARISGLLLLSLVLMAAAYFWPKLQVAGISSTKATSK